MFAVWKNLKYIILMHILNMIFKKIIMMKTQKITLNYIKILKMRLNSIIKIMFKKIKHEIIILWYKYLFLNRKEIKSAKIMKIMNIKIEDNNKKKIIIIKKFLNEDIILMLNSVKIKNHMIKKISWMIALKSKTCMIRICFMIIIKHVVKNIISQSNQKIITVKINT